MPSLCLRRDRGESMMKAKSEQAKQEEPKSRRAERRAAKRRAARRGESARAARRTDAERWIRLLVVGAVVAVILVAVGFIGFGWYQTQVKPLDKVVLRVEDTKFNLAHLERRMKLERRENSYFAGSGEELLGLPDSVYADLQLEAKLLEGADELNITVTEEEVFQRVRERGNLADDVAQSLFAEEFRQQVQDSGLKENEYRQMLRAELLKEKVRAYFVYLAPKTEEQVRARWILLGDQDLADETLQRLEAGEDFATVAQEVSLDSSTAEEGGELDWQPRGGFPDELEKFLFEGEPGQRSDVISARGLFYIAELLERQDDLTLGEQQRQQVANRQMNEWLGGLDGTLDIERDLTSEDALRALEDIL